MARWHINWSTWWGPVKLRKKLPTFLAGKVDILGLQKRCRSAYQHIWSLPWEMKPLSVFFSYCPRCPSPVRHLVPSPPHLLPRAIGIAPQIKQALGVQPGWEDNITNALVRNTSAMSSFNKKMCGELRVLASPIRSDFTQGFETESESANSNGIWIHQKSCIIFETLYPPPWTVGIVSQILFSQLSISNTEIWTPPENVPWQWMDVWFRWNSFWNVFFLGDMSVLGKGNDSTLETRNWREPRWRDSAGNAKGDRCRGMKQ